MTPAEHASRRHEQSLALQSVRILGKLGIGLAVIGVGGSLYGLGLTT